MYACTLYVYISKYACMYVYKTINLGLYMFECMFTLMNVCMYIYIYVWDLVWLRRRWQQMCWSLVRSHEGSATGRTAAAYIHTYIHTYLHTNWYMQTRTVWPNLKRKSGRPNKAYHILCEHTHLLLPRLRIHTYIHTYINLRSWAQKGLLRGYIHTYIHTVKAYIPTKSVSTVYMPNMNTYITTAHT
jgi:hypothetical protein